MSETLRVMTWNLWARNGPWRQRAGGIEAVIAEADPDLCCLQEVWRDEHGNDQATGLAERLGYEVTTSFDARDRPHMANAILSRWPLRDVEVLALPGVPGERSYRSVIGAVAEAPNGPVPIYVTHLHWPYDGSEVRVRQVRFVHSFVKRRRRSDDDAFPPVLAGDLNATPESAEVRQLTGREPGLRPGLVFHDAWPQVGDGPGYTWSGHNPHLAEASWPNRRVDYVLVAWPRAKPVGNPQAARLAGTEPVDGVVPSDHYAVVADLRSL